MFVFESYRFTMTPQFFACSQCVAHNAFRRTALFEVDGYSANYCKTGPTQSHRMPLK
jgi:hypothetical protein